tara:strand:+ start:1630 stop:1785 length:156 start_codon:yes stop_codon:yes gene_type:complete
MDINLFGTFTNENTFDSSPTRSPVTVIDTAGKKRKVKPTKKSYRKKNKQRK